MTMAEYIDREKKTPRYIDVNKIKLTAAVKLDETGNTLISIRDIREAIRQTPTADVVEVVHAMWNDRQCSNCAVFVPETMISDPLVNFCPHCGAQMDGGAE